MSRQPSAKSIDRMIADLKRIVVGGQVEISVKAGDYLLKELFNNDLGSVRSKDPRKTTSLRLLAERAAEFGMTPAGLRRSVPIALQFRVLGEELSLRLSVRHHLALLPLANPDSKRLLAELALKERLTAEELREKVRLEHQPHPGGRRPRPRAVLLVERSHRVLAPPHGNLREGLHELTAGEAKQLLVRARSSQKVLARIEKHLEGCFLALPSE